MSFNSGSWHSCSACSARCSSSCLYLRATTIRRRTLRPHDQGPHPARPCVEARRSARRGSKRRDPAPRAVPPFITYTAGVAFAPGILASRDLCVLTRLLRDFRRISQGRAALVANAPIARVRDHRLQNLPSIGPAIAEAPLAAARGLDAREPGVFVQRRVAQVRPFQQRRNRERSGRFPSPWVRRRFRARIPQTAPSPVGMDARARNR